MISLIWAVFFGFLGVVGCLSLLAFRAGYDSGRRCNCCKIKMQCRFCIVAGCKRAEHDPEIDG